VFRLYENFFKDFKVREFWTVVESKIISSDQFRHLPVSEKETYFFDLHTCLSYDELYLFIKNSDYLNTVLRNDIISYIYGDELIPRNIMA
jgi:hypothetical protein